MMRFAHHIQAIKFSWIYRVGAGTGVLAAQRLGTFMLRYYCFSIVLQKWLATLLLQPC